MARIHLGLCLALLCAGDPAAALPTVPQSAMARPQDGMTAFRSDAELREFLKAHGGSSAPPPPPAPPPLSSPAPPGVAPANDAGELNDMVVTATRIETPSITNTQVVGVDEGGIVKVSGRHLVVLRRGRLFTISTANGGLRAVDSIEAYPPGVDASNDWYDEMLISGDLIVVVGYSYGRGGTELNRFRIAPDGRLSFQDSHHLKSNDYYSDRNYASRLIGDQLIVYSPLELDYDEDPLEALPGLSRWTPGQAEDGEPRYRRIVSARQVYAPAPLRTAETPVVDALHTVTRCDLTAPRLDCESTVVLGPEGRSFFVSRNAVYVWLDKPWSMDDAPSWLYRLPLDGGRPGAVQVAGAPVDQFSFRAHPRENRLDILVTSESGGDAMWNSELASGRPALLRLPTSRFGDGSGAAPASDYRALPGDDQSYIGRDRFVGDTLLYSLNDGDRHRLVAAPVDDGAPTVFDLPYRVDRIEQIGRDALVVGGDDAATFLTINLVPGRFPAIGDRYVQPNAREAESRSHAFFFRPDAGSPDGQNGLMGLPVSSDLGADVAPPYGASVTDMLFLRRQAGRLGDFGRLDSDRSGARDDEDDGCVASCVDWYGGSRPIFLGDRVFALLGYELIEGDAGGASIRETRRLDFTPQAPAPARGD